MGIFVRIMLMNVLRIIVGVLIFDPIYEHDTSFFELGVDLNGFGS